jgi:hypothetical protein
MTATFGPLCRGRGWQGVVFALVTATASAASAQAVSQDTPGHGKINWTDRTITVTGSGAPDLNAANVAVAREGAERAAKLDAMRNILEAVKGVKISANATGANAMAAPEIIAKVHGAISGFKVLDIKYYSDGGVDMIVQVPLDKITDALVSDAGTKVSAGTGAAAGTTGIIINAKGLAVAPALAPKLTDEKGTVVYSSGSVAKDAMTGGGVCGYLNNLEAAKKDPRVGAKPLVLKALRIPEKGSADLVLADADAAKLAQLGDILAKGSVVIVTD